MSTLALELDQLLKQLAPAEAERLEIRVRAVIREVSAPNETPPALEVIKRRRPELAEYIGSLAGMEFELPDELPLPPAKEWK